MKISDLSSHSLVLCILLANIVSPKLQCLESCISGSNSCKSLYKLDFEKVVKEKPCKYQGINGNRTVHCCQSEEAYNKFKEKLRLTELARALTGAERNEYPHQVQFRASDKRGRCGGTIYNKEWVITGAHCIRYKGSVVGKVGVSYIIAGQSYIGSVPKQDRNTVAEIIVHEDYDDHVMGKGNDIALLRLERPLQLEKGRIQPLRLENADFVPDYGGRGLVIGWGNVHESMGVGTFDLMEANAPIHEVTKAARLSWDRENGTDSPYFNPLPQHLSIGGEDSGITVGQGDSGGPFICADQGNKPVLCGIASFKRCVKFKNCRRPNWYIRLAPFISWINNHTNNAKQEEEFLLDEPMFPTKLKHHEIPTYLVRIIGKTKSCTGALVGSQWNVLTSADCMLSNSKDVSKVNLVLFVHHFRSGKMYRLRRAFVDFKYQNDTSQEILSVFNRPLKLHDFAAFTLELPVGESIPLELPPEHYKMSVPAIEYAMNEKVSSVETRKYLPMDLDECERKFQAVDPNLESVHPDYLCMRQVYSAEAECERDEGAPLVCDNKYLCGIKTFQPCKFSGFPQIFSNTLNGSYIRRRVVEITKSM